MQRSWTVTASAYILKQHNGSNEHKTQVSLKIAIGLAEGSKPPYSEQV